MSSAVTGRRSAMRYEMRESWRMSFSVSLAIQDKIGTGRGRSSGSSEHRPALCGELRACGPLRRLARLARLAGTRGAREVRAAPDRAIEARPARARGQLLLEAVDRAQAAAEVVAEVHERRLARAGEHRAAVLEAAVVAEDDVQHRLGRARIEAVDLLDEPAHPVVAERDLALQLAGIGHLD